jgi:hypothetical protein
LKISSGRKRLRSDIAKRIYFDASTSSDIKEDFSKVKQLIQSSVQHDYDNISSHFNGQPFKIKFCKTWVEHHCLVVMFAIGYADEANDVLYRKQSRKTL